MFIRSLAVAAFVALFQSGALAGEFRGSSALDPNSADPTGETRILRGDFFYQDDAELVWKANAGNITNGASIPRELQILVGRPFDPDILGAAIIHDHYCDKQNSNRVRSWRATHRAFYEMLRDSEVPVVKSKVMYYAVYTFGPKWGYLDQGDYCGRNCINNVTPRYFEKNEYSFHTSSLDEFDTVLEALERDPELSLDHLDALAEARHPYDNAFGFTQYPGAPADQ